MKALRYNRRGEYLYDRLGSHFANCGMTHELTASYSSFQNGVAECLKKTLIELVRRVLRENICQRGYGQKHWLLPSAFELESDTKSYLLIVHHATSGRIPLFLYLVRDSLAVNAGMLC